MKQPSLVANDGAQLTATAPAHTMPSRPTAPASPPESLRLFVYGTLKRGESNHGLLGGRSPVRTARTTPSYELVDLGDYPAMVEGGDTAVFGEVYAVDTETLDRVDEFEEHPSLYERRTIRLDDGEEVFGYVMRSETASGRPTIVSGDFSGVRVDRRTS